MAGGLDETTVSTLCAASRPNRAVRAGESIGPENNLPAATRCHRVCGNERIATHEHRIRVVLGALSLIVATDQNGAATSITGRVDARAVEEADVLAQNFHRAPGRAGHGAARSEGAGVAYAARGAALQDRFALARVQRVA